MADTVERANTRRYPDLSGNGWQQSSSGWQEYETGTFTSYTILKKSYKKTIMENKVNKVNYNF